MQTDSLFCDLREDDEYFPIGCNTSPIALIWIEKGEIQTKYMQGWCKSRSRMVAENIRELRDKKIPFKIIGTWSGEYSSNMFNLNPERIEKLLELHGS